MNKRIQYALTGLIVSYTILLAIGNAFILIMWRGDHSGIIPHDSGEAVYISGEACTINAHKNISSLEFFDMAMWCYKKHYYEVHNESSVP